MAAMRRAPDEKRGRMRADEAEAGRRARHPEAVFAERDPELVRELYHLAVDGIGGFCPKAAGLLEDAEPDALVCLDFPRERHVRLRTSNVQERRDRELKRRARVVQVFPGGRSLIRLLGAVFSEMDE